MNSKEFFDNDRFNSKWKNISGIYIIENPVLSAEYGEQINKIGYASHSLYTRIADYRTAYGPIPFKIHAIYHIPEKVKYKRVQYARICEKILHETLKDEKVKQTNEWFVNFKKIMTCFNQLRANHLKEIDGSKDWPIFNKYRSGAYTKKIKLVDEEKIFPSGTITKLLSRFQPDRQKKIVGMKGAVDKDNQIIDGVVISYDEYYKIKLENGEKLKVSIDDIDAFVKRELKVS